MTTKVNTPVVPAADRYGQVMTMCWILAVGFGAIGVPFGFFEIYGQVTGALALFGAVLAVVALVRTRSWLATLGMALCLAALCITTVTQVRFYQDMQNLEFQFDQQQGNYEQWSDDFDDCMDQYEQWNPMDPSQPVPDCG